jgi:hypothetical protein
MQQYDYSRKKEHCNSSCTPFYDLASEGGSFVRNEYQWRRIGSFAASTPRPKRIASRKRDVYLRTRVLDAREGAFVYPKLDFTAAVIEFQVPALDMGAGGNS